MGIMSAVQAAGNIRNYQITMGCIILLNVPIAYVLLKYGYPVYYVTIGYVIIELISLIVRVIMADKLVQMRPTEYLKNVVYPTLMIIVPSLALCFIPHYMISSLWLRLIITCFVYAVSFMLLMWFVAFNREQRDQILTRVKTNIWKR